MAAQASPAVHVEAEPAPETKPIEEQIASLAYELWEKRGRPHGSPETDWFEAEMQLSSLNSDKE